MNTPVDKPIIERPEKQIETKERQRRARVANQARDLIVHLGTLVKQLRVHAVTNNSVKNHIESTRNAIEALRKDDQSISVVFAEGHTFVNGIWVRASKIMWSHATDLTTMLGNIKSRGMTLEPSMDMDALLNLTSTLHKAAHFSEPRDVELDIPGLKLVPVSDADSGKAGRGAIRDEAFNAIKEGLQVLSPVEVRRLDVFMRRRQRGLVQKLIEIAEGSTEDLLALTAIRDPSLPTAIHTLMVTIFSIGLGKAIGLPRRDLLRLGTAALNHNLGESFVDQNVFAQGRALTPEEKQSVEIHPLIGMHYVLQHYGLERTILERAFVIAEHHIHWNGAGGYPFSTNANTHAFSRIIAICDVFNALISARPHRKAYPPDQALKIVMRASGEQLDPVLVRAFVSLVGRYPTGAVVEVDTGEWGVVLGPGRGKTPLRRPRVLIVTDEDGFEIPEVYAVDLGELRAQDQGWNRTIVRSHDPGSLTRKLASYLLADRIEVEAGRMDNAPANA